MHNAQWLRLLYSAAIEVCKTIMHKALVRNCLLKQNIIIPSLRGFSTPGGVAF